MNNDSAIKNNRNMAFWEEVKSLQKKTLGVPGIKIAILDGTIDSSHPCFKGVRLLHINTLAAPVKADAGSDHGTHVTSIILGRREAGVPGIAPGCYGLIAPIFRGKDRLKPCQQINLAHAIHQAVRHGAHIINISGGESAGPKQMNPLLEQAIRHCARKKVLIIAAAGNDGCQCTHIPAAGPGVLVVGAMDSWNVPMKLSNWGEAYQDRGILAPGWDIIGAIPGGGVSKASGTSFATAIVTGVVGLLLSIQLMNEDIPDPHFIAKAILKSAHPCNPQIFSDCRKHLSGSLNISGAYALVKQALRRKTPRAFLSNGTYENSAFANQSAVLGMPYFLSVAGITASSFSGHNSMKRLKKASTVGEKTVSQDKRSKVYINGKLGYDYGSVVVRDSYREKMEETGSCPDIPSDLLRHLDAYSHEPQEVMNIIWTLTVNETPVYVIRPAPAFSGIIYQRLIKYLEKQITNQTHMITIGGVIAGTKRLLDRQILPVVIPDPRMMFQWSINTLVKDLLGKTPKTQTQRICFNKIHEFLSRLIYELSNTGLDPVDRVLNFVATKALEIKQIFESAVEKEMEFSGIKVELPDFQRPGSQCRKVILMFSDPGKPSTRARRVYGFTVDISEVIPVTIGEVHSWSVY